MLKTNSTKGHCNAQRTAIALALAAMAATGHGQAGGAAYGIGPLGSSGGLVIPKARTLDEGVWSLGVSNIPEAGLGNPPSPRSIVTGLGLWPGLEVSGRFAEYAFRQDGLLLGGISDLSLNAKASFSWGDGPTAPRWAVGLLDYGGQATNFRSTYLVGTQALGPWDLTLGLGRSTAVVRVPGQKRALDGVFGGLSYQATSDKSPWGQWELAAEHDGRQALGGLRWASPALAALGHGRVTMALHRALANGTAHPAATTWTVGLNLPFAEKERRAAQIEAPAAQPSPLPATVLGSATAQLGRLKDALVAAKLERVRVGRNAAGAWVVEYQNRRFGQNEVDAMGLVVGLAVQAAPQDLRQLVVVAHKQGQPVLTLRTDPQVWRNFLSTGLPGLARGVTQVQRGGGESGVDWVNDSASGATLAQMQISPELSYAVGTDVGMADHSLAGRVMLTAGLWKGAQVVVAAQEIVSASRQAQPGSAFAATRQTEGLYTLALHQTVWLGDRAVLGAAVGRFELGARGAEGEAVVFMPWRDDVVRLRGRALEKVVDQPRYADLAGAASYRWTPSPSVWAEVGAQRYSDGSAGPTVVFTRWWGDVGAHLFYRQGGWRKYAGVELSFPLTPRSGAAWQGVQVQGHPSWKRGLRSMVDNPANYVEHGKVRDLQFTWDLETQALNAGRLGPEYTLAQLPRMREAYFLYAPQPASR